MSRTRTVLLAEDEPVLLRLISRVLEGAGYQVRRAESVEETRSALADEPLPDTLVLDATLARRLGAERLEGLLARRPRPAIVLVSGAEPGPALAPLLTHARFLAKPFEPAQLLHELQAALAERSEGVSGGS